MADDIPQLSAPQRRAFREFILRHLDEDTCSTTPLRLARVLAHDKPATLLLSPSEVSPSQEQPDEYLVSFLSQIELPHRQFAGLSGWVVASTSWRLDLLPTQKSFCDAYHRRLGVVFGYPSEAIDYFIHNDGSEPTPFDLVQSGTFEPEELAHAKFVCYSCPKTPEIFEDYLSIGWENRRQIGQLARAWNLPELDEIADEVYTEAVEEFKTGEMPSTSNLTINFDWETGQQISGYSRN